MKRILILVLALMLLLGGCEAAPAQQTTQTEPELQIPNFTVYDAEGNPYKLSDFVGKPIVLNFWATWCNPCQQAGGKMPWGGVQNYQKTARVGCKIA